MEIVWPPKWTDLLLKGFSIILTAPQGEVECSLARLHWKVMWLLAFFQTTFAPIVYCSQRVQC